MTLSEDINLAVISDMCEHFTGADFKALLYNAQLAAIHRNANNSQLYKAMFKNTEMESTEKYDRCAETGAVTEEDRDNVIYVPSLTEGSIQLSTEELTKLHSEVGFCYCCTPCCRNARLRRVLCRFDPPLGQQNVML